MAPRRARRRPSGVNRRMLTQRQKLAMQRNPLLQGPVDPPQQGPRLAIPRNLTSEVKLPSKPTPAPQQIDICNPAPKSAPKPSNNLMNILKGVMDLRAMMTPAGAAAVASRPTAVADGTLTAAMKRGDYKPSQGPKNPDKGLSKAGSFDKAFAAARAAGKDVFTWNGKKYTTELA